MAAMGAGVWLPAMLALCAATGVLGGAVDVPAAPLGGGVLGYVADMMHYLTGVASELVASGSASPVAAAPETLPDEVVVPDDAPELLRRPAKFKYTVEELLHSHFDRKLSNDIDIDPCKAGE